MAGATRWWPICAPKATSSTRWWPAARRAVGRTHTRAGLDDRTPDRAPAVDRSRRADRRHRRGRVSPALLRSRGGEPDRVRRRGRRGTRGHPARAAAGRVARHPGTAARRTAGRRRRPQAAVVRPADERRVDGHRPADGDLGARARRRRRAGRTRPATARLRSIAHIGVRTRDFAFAVNGLAPPAEPFRVELRAPDGSTWSWGPDDAAQRVTGSAEDFCMLVTQRRPRRRWT